MIANDDTVAALLGVITNIREFDITFKNKTYNNKTCKEMMPKLIDGTLSDEDLLDLLEMLACYYRKDENLRKDTISSAIVGIKLCGPMYGKNDIVSKHLRNAVLLVKEIST